MTSIWNWIGAILEKQDLPAWLQAFAALVAIAISVWASLRVGAYERRKDALLAQGIAVAIYPEILKLEVSIKQARDGLEALRVRAGGKLVGQSIAADFGSIAQIPVPPMLDRNTDRLYVLGKVAGPSCLQLVSVLMQYNTFIDEVAARIVMLNATQWGEFVNQAEDHLKLVSQVIDKCEHEVKEIYSVVGNL